MMEQYLEDWKLDKSTIISQETEIDDSTAACYTGARCIATLAQW